MSAGRRYRILNLLALFATSGIILVLVLASVGAFDPKPAGKMIWQQELPSMQVNAGATETLWLDRPLPEVPLTVRLTAHRESGEDDAGYGLLLGSGDSLVAVVVSPLGYVAIWKQLIPGNVATVVNVMPWQTWPHVNTAKRPNEILVDILGDTIVVRLNRERLWEGKVPAAIDRVGTIGVSYGRATTIDFGTAALFTQYFE